MKNCLINIDDLGKIKVTLKGDNYTHKNLRDMKRALEVEFRQYHYRITHSLKESVEV